MKLLWSEAGWETYVYWQMNDSDILHKVNGLIKDTNRSPFKGLGKPEPLKDNLRVWWSRRITREHLFVYRVTGSPGDQMLEIASCRFHY